MELLVVSRLNMIESGYIQKPKCLNNASYVEMSLDIDESLVCKGD